MTLEELKALRDGITPGEWDYGFPEVHSAEGLAECREADCQVSVSGFLIANVSHGPIYPAEPHGSNCRESNARAIAALPALLDQCIRQQEEIERLRDMLGMPGKPVSAVIADLCRDDPEFAARYQAAAREAQGSQRFVRCHFSGPSPDGFNNWYDWMQSPVLTGAHICSASYTPPPSVPDGYALVPIEPTPEMLSCIVYQEFREDWSAGKELQAKQIQEGRPYIPPKTEYEIAVGQYNRLLNAAKQEGE